MINFKNREKGIIGRHYKDFSQLDIQRIINILECPKNKNLHLRLYCNNLQHQNIYYYFLVFGHYKVIYSSTNFCEMYNFITYVGIDMKKILMPTNFTLYDMFDYMTFENNKI